MLLVRFRQVGMADGTGCVTHVLHLGADIAVSGFESEPRIAGPNIDSLPFDRGSRIVSPA
jgi:hypothetical protein